MILYDLYFIDKNKEEYPICEYLTICKAIDAIKKDIKGKMFLSGDDNGGVYRLEEFNSENPSNVLRIFELKQV